MMLKKIALFVALGIVADSLIREIIYRVRRELKWRRYQKQARKRVAEEYRETPETERRVGWKACPTCNGTMIDNRCVLGCGRN